MGIKFYITRQHGQEIGFQHSYEREAALQIARQLWRQYQLSAGSNHYALIANPQIPPADLIILSSNGVGILDLKHYSGKIRGKDTSRWVLVDEHGADGKEIKGGNNYLNPLEQVKFYKYRILEMLRSLAKKSPAHMPKWMQDEKRPLHAQTAVVFTAGAMDTSELELAPQAVEPWFKILQTNDINNWAYSLVFGSERKFNLRLNPAHIDFIARHGFGTEEWIEIGDILRGGEPYGYLWVMEDGKRTWQYMLTDAEIAIGRMPDNHISIASDLYGQVSKHHVQHRKSLSA